jgi:mannose-6-phosphate isomerase-like protein (cupin superfamily)
MVVLGISLTAADRPVDPTFLRRFAPHVAEKPSDVTIETCRYKPIFGLGDSETSIVRGFARYGELTVAPGGASKMVSYPSEEQIYVVLEGSGVLHYGEEKVPVRKNDFMYVPPGIQHTLSNPSGQPCRAIVMGFKIPGSAGVMPPAKLLLANIDDVQKQTLAWHGDSTLYQLLMGNIKSTKDKLAAAQEVVDLFLMTIQPGGTNRPHHHENLEEIYLVLDGEGDMVAGSGVDGIEGRYPAKPGDVYFFRLNCTVGFYASSKPGAKPARILAVQSLFPGRRSD